MIGSFITGSASRFLLRFIPSIADSIFRIYETKAKQKHEMDMARLQVETQVTLKELESDAPLKMAKLESTKPKTKIEWIIGLNDLMRPLTTVFWVVVYPAAFFYMVSAFRIRSDPFVELSLFYQDVAGLILGFWYTDGIVKKKG